MDYDSVMDSSDDEFFQSPSSFLGPVDLALGRPSLRRSDHRRSLLLPSTDAVDILNEIMSILTGDHSDESVEGDNDDSSMADDALTQPKGLLDLCSRVVAENYSCADLDGHNLDEALLRKISFWAFPQDVHRVRAYAYLTDRLVSWRRGVALVKDEKIKEMWQVGFMATAYIAKHGQQSDSRTKSEIRVSLTFEKQKIISSTCSECKNEVWCEHIIAAVLHKIKNPSAVRVHGPMTEALSTLDRNQLQKLLQYAVYEDPAGILGKVFKHLDDIRDTNSEMSRTEGAPDPTYGGLSLGDKSQWELSLELLDKRLVSDLDAMIRAGSYFNYAEGRNQEYYPDNYDIMLKMQSKFFTYITPVLELARQNEHQAAAEVMQHVANTIIQKMSSNSHTDCPNLSRLWHDLSHIFTLLLLRTDDHQARNLLISTSQGINRIGGALLSEHMLEMSQWAELPSLTLLFPVEVIKLKEEGFTLLEPLVAKFLSPKLPELQQFLEGKDSIEMSTYSEDLVVMIARLETLFYFEREKSFQKISRLAFMVLHKLAILAQQDSVIGAYHPSQRTSGSLGSSLFEVTMQGSNSLARTNSPGPVMLKSVFYGKGKSGRSSNKDKHPAKRFKSSVDHVTVANLNKGQVAYSMMYTLRLMIATQKATSMELENKKLLTGFCLQALELSRHRTLASSDSITAAEQDWLLKLETCICDYLQTASIDAVVDAVVMYIDTIIANGTKFYNGAYPLVLLEMLCHLCTKNDSLKTSKGRHLVQICSEILLNSTTCLEKVTIPTVRALDFFWEVLMDGGGSLSNPRKHRDFAVRKFHVITETFLSLVGTDTPEDIDLLVQILQHFENIKTVPLLKMISKDLRMHVWRFKEEHRVIEAMLRFSIHAYRESQSPLNLGSETKRVESIDREFVFSLARKLGVMSLPIFSECWQNIFSCKDLQELVLFMEPKCNEGNDLPEAVLKIIMEFYDAKRFHEEDACTLLTRFFKPNDKNYDIVVNKILENFDTYHSAALFNLAKLQQERKSGRWKNAMNGEVFSIIVKAFEKISVVSAKILEYVDWVFTVCTYCIQKEPTRSMFYKKMIQCICLHAKAHPEIILKVLQSMESHDGLMAHSSAVDLGHALIAAYKEHFLCRFRDCGHAAYATVIGEMQRARLECKHYIKNGESDFDSEVVDFIRRMHSTKKKLMKLLENDFPV